MKFLWQVTFFAVPFFGAATAMQNSSFSKQRFSRPSFVSNYSNVRNSIISNNCSTIKHKRSTTQRLDESNACMDQSVISMQNIEQKENIPTNSNSTKKIEMMDLSKLSHDSKAWNNMQDANDVGIKDPVALAKLFAKQPFPAWMTKRAVNNYLFELPKEFAEDGLQELAKCSCCKQLISDRMISLEPLTPDVTWRNDYKMFLQTNRIFHANCFGSYLANSEKKECHMPVDFIRRLPFLLQASELEAYSDAAQKLTIGDFAYNLAASFIVQLRQMSEVYEEAKLNVVSQSSTAMRITGLTLTISVKDFVKALAKLSMCVAEEKQFAKLVECAAESVQHGSLETYVEVLAETQRIAASIAKTEVWNALFCPTTLVMQLQRAKQISPAAAKMFCRYINVDECNTEITKLAVEVARKILKNSNNLLREMNVYELEALQCIASM